MVHRVAVVLVLASLALAFPSSRAVADPVCAEDIRKFCADTPPGGGRVQRCLNEHAEKISSECRARLDDLVREAGLLGAVCRWDIGRFCSDVAPGGARVVGCLEKNAGELSLECKQQLDKK